MKIRGKRNKQDNENQFTGVVPSETADGHASTSEEDLTVKETRSTAPAKSVKEPPKSHAKSPDRLLVTDSWCKVNQADLVTPSADSSSDSVFAEALTPVGFSAEINQCYRSEDSFPAELEVVDNFLHDLTLNSFKLNEYHQVKKGEEVIQKLSKLGISKTSQISLETDPNECFVSENVEVVKKDERDSEVDGEESGFGGSNEYEKSNIPETSSTLRKITKRLSDTNLSNGKCILI